MSWIQALILGSLQGLTEFFPVSSSAHLKLAKFFLNVAEGQNQVLFDLTCHLGTLIALLYFFKRDLSSLRRPAFLLALLPLIPCYFLLKPLRECLGRIEFLGFCLIGTSVLLFLGHFLKLKATRSKQDPLYIGAMQALALIPGISRSASTIAAARLLGWDPKEAVRFSFLLAIPTIIGGNTLELVRLSLAEKSDLSLSFASCLIGFLSSLGIGWLVIRFAMTLLERGTLKPFAWYCLCMGVLLSFKFYG